MVTLAWAHMHAGEYLLDGEEWQGVSYSARDMISHMLCVDSAERWSPEQLLEHAWFEVGGCCVLLPGADAQPTLTLWAGSPLMGFKSLARPRHLRCARDGRSQGGAVWALPTPGAI